jgi:linoleoyl-CoA desaturase
MWNIYGKKYDLTKFIEFHPGGKDIIQKTKNQKDITALFETYHAFSNLDKIKQTLNKYEITDINDNINDNINTKEKYKYDFTNYHKLLEEVKLLFPNRKCIKSTPFFVMIDCVIFLTYISCFFTGMLSTYSLFFRAFCSFIAGLTYISLGFNVMHDASHFAISTNENVNNILNKIWHSWGLWNSKIWFYHHVYNHHSFTGIEKNDPDLYHLRPFGQKVATNANANTRSQCNNNNWLLKNQSYTIPYFLILFPGQYFGQCISYFLTLSKQKIFTIKLHDKTHYDVIDILLIITKLFCLYKGLYFNTIIYIISLNFWYSINIVGDHDTYETAIENHYNGNDWCKMQICNSGNFVKNSMIWTYLFGGINYQIEHHLFPNVSHIHYPAISIIVQKYCKDNNIPYAHQNSIYETYQSFLKMMKYRSIH